MRNNENIQGWWLRGIKLLQESHCKPQWILSDNKLSKQISKKICFCFLALNPVFLKMSNFQRERKTALISNWLPDFLRFFQWIFSIRRILAWQKCANLEILWNLTYGKKFLFAQYIGRSGLFEFKWTICDNWICASVIYPDCPCILISICSPMSLLLWGPSVSMSEV